MATFVLVHGAWHGGWYWRDTAAALRAAGHTVHTPTHSGVGERAHQSSEAITLEPHICDVCGTIEMEEAHDIILCGHSDGGMVITGVADRVADRIKALVYLDAFVPKDGDSLISLPQCEKAGGWSVVKMPIGHDVMVDMPKELADELMKLV